MPFNELTRPEYKTDREWETANPIWIVRDVWLPGIRCPVCGGTWAGSRRLYLPVPDPALRRRLGGKPLPEAEWVGLAQDLRRVAGLPDEFELIPGDVLGTPIAELLAPRPPDLMQPFPGQWVVRDTVVWALEEAALTGYRALPVAVSWAKSVKNPPGEPPPLYELVVTGSAWRQDTDLASITACQHCHRTTFPDPKWLAVDERRWDGSDFFHVDRNTNIVLVTQRVSDVLAQHHFTNYRCIPIL